MAPRMLITCLRRLLSLPKPPLSPSLPFSTSASAQLPLSPPPPRPRAPLRSLGKHSSALPYFQSDCISLRRLIEEHRWDSTLEASLRSSSVPLSDGLIVEVIKSLSEAKLSLRFFIWIVQQQLLSPSSTAVGVLSRRWCHEKQFGAFLNVLDKVCHGIEPLDVPPASFLILLTGYGWAGMAEKALQTLESMMVGQGPAPDASHFLCVINILEHEKLLESVPRVYRRMVEAGFFPDAQTCRKLISGLCIAGYKEEALNILHDMKARNLRPEADTYRILLSMFSKANCVTEVLTIFHEILEDDIEPDSKACNALVKAFCLDGKFCEAMEVLEMMLARGFNPNLASLSLLVEGLFDAGDIDQVFALWEKLRKSSIPTIMFHHRLMEELSNAGKLDAAEIVFEDIKKNGSSPPENVYAAFISGLSKAGDSVKAQKYMQEKASSVAVHDVSFQGTK